MRKLVALLLLSYRCIVTINVLWLFLTVPGVGLQYVIVVFFDHTHFLNVVFIKMKCWWLQTGLPDLKNAKTIEFCFG